MSVIPVFIPPLPPLPPRVRVDAMNESCAGSVRHGQLLEKHVSIVGAGMNRCQTCQRTPRRKELSCTKTQIRTCDVGVKGLGNLLPRVALVLLKVSNLQMFDFGKQATISLHQLLPPVGATQFQALVLITGRLISCSAIRCRSPILLNQLGNREFELKQLQPEIKFAFLTFEEGEVTVRLLDNRNALRSR